jgi:hypothetical protein
MLVALSLPSRSGLPGLRWGTRVLATPYTPNTTNCLNPY